MSDSNVEPQPTGEPVVPSGQPAPTPDDELEKKFDERFKNLKATLDRAYSARDDALKKVAAFEKAQKEAELKRLEEEGRHKELYEMQLTEERAKREALELQNVTLTRDIELKNILSAYEFRNPAAHDMAFRELLRDVSRSSEGAWQIKGGNMQDGVAAFLQNEANTFLLKPKQSSGSGSTAPVSAPSQPPKSLFEMSQDEVLQLAREGKLPNRK
jgi:hypothetical protein